MVLIDTSIWIRFLAGVEPYASKLDQLPADDQVLGHDFVYGELLIGDRGARPRLLTEYRLIRQVALVAHSEVVEFVRYHRISGRGIGWVDAHLLASAIVANSKLWTADRPLVAVAEDIGVAYRF